MENQNTENSGGSTDGVKILTRLAEMPAKALLDEAALAEALGVTKRTIRRMVARFELPPPIALAGKSTWIAERVTAHIEARAERAARKAEQEARRIEALPFSTPTVKISSEKIKEFVSEAAK